MWLKDRALSPVFFFIKIHYCPVKISKYLKIPRFIT